MSFSKPTNFFRGELLANLCRFRAISGGIDWAEAAEALRPLGC